MAGKLTDRAVKTVAAGRYLDGAVRGLSLLVKRSGARSWVLRYQLNGRRRDMGLGPYPEVTLADARQRALDLRRVVKVEKRDPVGERKRVLDYTFKAAAEALLDSKRPGWSNAKHIYQWEATLSTANRTLGALDVKQVETADVLAVLQPIWADKTETASRLRQRIEAVLDFAAALGKRTGANPARWKGHLDHLLPKPSRVKKVGHHAALDWREAPAFMADLVTRPGAGVRPLAFAILTAARSGEVRGATWAEVDDAAMVWTIAGCRMKAGKEHRVPLTPSARVLLGERGRPDALVFPSPTDALKPLSSFSLMQALRRMGRGDLTAHGMRSAFRDWAAEATAHPREVIEHALAHQLKDRAEAAYQRGDLFVKRRRLMADWAEFLTRPVAEVLELPVGGQGERLAG